MDDERRELIRRLFAALTVQAEACAEVAVQGQAPTIAMEIASKLAKDAITIAQLMSVISEAIHALAADTA